MVDVVPISVAPAPNLFHHNNVGVTYVRTSNFKVEPIKSVPLYFVAMPHSMITVTEAPFTITPTHTITSVKSKPQTPRGINLVSMHTKMPRKVDKFFVGQPSNLGGGLGPSRPSRYFGLPMVNPSIPPLPPNQPYHRPFNYPKM